MSVDRRRWKGLGVSPDLGTPAHELGDAYLALCVKAARFFLTISH